MRIRYDDSQMGEANLTVVANANRIISVYMKRGFRLTVRQIYYQFVARGWLPNSVRNYKRLASILNDGRIQGLIDWNAIEDRTRSLTSIATSAGPKAKIESTVKSFAVNMWRNQPYEIEIWVEKEALAGVIERTANRFRIPFLSCRGYTSQSEMHLAAMRLKRRIIERKKKIVILHLGDFDPSGVDMSRDIYDRLQLFMGREFELLTFRRIALNPKQILKYKPPPNPAKATDSRFRAFKEKYGSQSWELDALNPTVIDRLLTRAIDKYRDLSIWDADVAREDKGRGLLQSVADRWSEVVKYLEDNPK